LKSVLITGSGKRVGAEIARRLGARGWHVFVHYHESKEGAAEVVKGIADQGGSATAIGADLGDEAQVLSLVDRCEAIAPLSCLINNASLFEYDDIGTVQIESLDRMMRVNLYAATMLSRALADKLRPAGGEGCIINIVDNKVYALNPDYLSYTLAKLALHGLTEILALALAPRIRVCGVAPGITLPSKTQSAENFAKARSNNLLRKPIAPDQIARTVEFILDTPSINGETIVVDGGQVLMHLPRDVALL
jgi:NAD(P)-dependent dehydrogenase (short-subunit alcohol dehydrogenase family)